MDYQGGFFKICRGILRLIKRNRYDVPPKESFPNPAVYICRHGNMMGPVLSIANFPVPVHPWCLNVLCEREACYQHCADYTFSERFGWNKWIAKAAAWLVAPGFAYLLQSAGSIPVYRNSLKVRTTFRLSQEALERGENVLIFPDVDYTTEEGDTGELYEGFLLLEQMYFRKTGRHLPFVPIHVSASKKRLAMDEAVIFQDGVTYAQDKGRVLRELQEAMNRLAAENGD